MNRYRAPIFHTAVRMVRMTCVLGSFFVLLGCAGGTAGTGLRRLQGDSMMSESAAAPALEVICPLSVAGALVDVRLSPVRGWVRSENHNRRCVVTGMLLSEQLEVSFLSAKGDYGRMRYRVELGDGKQALRGNVPANGELVIPQLDPYVFRSYRVVFESSRGEMIAEIAFVSET